MKNAFYVNWKLNEIHFADSLLTIFIITVMAFVLKYDNIYLSIWSLFYMWVSDPHSTPFWRRPKDTFKNLVYTSDITRKDYIAGLYLYPLLVSFFFSIVIAFIYLRKQSIVEVTFFYYVGYAMLPTLLLSSVQIPLFIRRKN